MVHRSSLFCLSEHDPWFTNLVSILRGTWVNSCQMTKMTNRSKIMHYWIAKTSASASEKCIKNVNLMRRGESLNVLLTGYWPDVTQPFSVHWNSNPQMTWNLCGNQLKQRRYTVSECDINSSSAPLSNGCHGSFLFIFIFVGAINMSLLIVLVIGALYSQWTKRNR